MKYLTFLMTGLILAACGKSQTPSDPLHAVAVNTCKATIESRAINPKTVSYLGVDVKPGAAQLISTIDFSAKNEIGIAATMQARCVTSADGKSLVDIAVNTR